MLVHTVFFWLKEDLSTEQRQQFLDGVKPLLDIKPNVMITLGTPAATEQRPVIDSSYDYSLTCIFESIADHDTYQIDPAHLKFIEECKTLWSKVLVYDAD